MFGWVDASCAQAPVGGDGSAATTDTKNGVVGQQQQNGGYGRKMRAGVEARDFWLLAPGSLDHTEALSVSLACGSSLTRPEPDPILREDTRAAVQQPITSSYVVR